MSHKSIFRPISEGEEVTDIIVKCIVFIVVVGLLWIFASAGVAVYKSSKSVEVQNERGTKAGSIVPLGDGKKKTL